MMREKCVLRRFKGVDSLRVRLVGMSKVGKRRSCRKKSEEKTRRKDKRKMRCRMRKKKKMVKKKREERREKEGIIIARRITRTVRRE